jgi:D-psicose/D-tagatose/L-ribulose 3-epimerase
MKVAISNIAWGIEEEPAVGDLMMELGIDGVEVAPGRIGPKPAELDDDTIWRYRASWNERGIEIVAMQALLFGVEGVTIFESEASRRAMGDYLARIIRLGGMLGAKALVFGSPKNRKVGKLTPAQITSIAVPFFREMGAVAAGHETCLCIEPNPPAYGADWITSAKEAQAFVEQVAHPGFGLHLDAGALHMQGEGVAEIRAAGRDIRHFHASQPQLAPLQPGGEVPHETYAAELRAMRYSRWVSVEMRQVPGQTSSLATVETALRCALGVYGG